MSVDVLDAGPARHGEIVCDEALAARAKRLVVGREVDKIRRVDDRRVNAALAPPRGKRRPCRSVVFADLKGARVACEYLDALATGRRCLGNRAGELSTDAHVNAESHVIVSSLDKDIAWLSR